MRSKKRLQRQFSLNKVLFASGFLFLLFLLFFVVFSLLFFLFVFWRSVFLLRVFSQVCLFFWWLAYFDSIQFVHLLSWALVFSLCLPSSLPCSFSFSLFLVIFFLLPITRSRRGECVLSTYIGHSPSCSYPKRNLKYVADGAGGEERGRGDAWVCVPPF